MQILQRRVGLLFGVFLTLLVLAGIRTLWLAGAKGGSLSSAAASQQVTSATLPALRGSIVDRRGEELAVSEPASDISATPYLVKDPVKTAQRLAPILGVPVASLVQKLARDDTGFVYLKRELPAEGAAEVRKLGMPGIDLAPSHLRVYPRGFLASQLLGMVGTEGHGLAGLEYASDKLLAGRDGQRRQVKDALGQAINIRDPRPAIPGSQVQLTIDAALQDKVEEVLGQVGARFQAKGATAIVMDPNTGEVLALANWPRVNANWPLTASPTWARQERSVGFNYEPGSTFKSFTVAGALEDKLVTPDTPFYLPAQIKVADRVIGEAHLRGDVTLTTAQILAQSSNVGAIKIGQELGEARFDKWVRRFGFGKPTGIELPGEQRGIVLKLSQYSGSSMGNMPIGQGLSVTPMQMARAYSAIANGGTLLQPHIIKRLDGKLVAHTKGQRVISEHTSLQLRQMLEGAFAPGGTASEVSIPNYKLAGKTGTANKIDPTTGEYSDTRYVASFFGFVPALKPKLVIGVVVDEPAGGNIYGGQVAAPAFGDIASFALQYLRIPPQ